MNDKAILLICIILVLSGTIVFLAFRLSKMAKVRDEVISEVKALKKKLGTVQLDYVETKLNPHLFKNILNSVQSHAYQTYISLNKLSGVLDYVLYESSQRFVTPQQEIEFTTNLIEINKIKINPLFDFRVKYNIDENDPVFETKVLAPLITVDLIENAFKHTNFLADNSFILIHISFQKGILEVKVQNRVSEKAPMEKDHGGFGAQSLDQRLKMIYKNNFSLRKNLQNLTYTAHLKIDLHDKYNQVRYSR
jgi:LytS/YehU family sensor histidine kinase